MTEMGMSLAMETEFRRKSRDLPLRALSLVDVGAAHTSDPVAIEALAEEWRNIWEGVGFTGIVNPGFDAVGESLPTCTDADNPQKHPTQNYWEFSTGT
jgi:hypothetical protein